jgi:hypothetical protein
VLRYRFSNLQTGQDEEYLDNNDSKNYTLGINPNPGVRLEIPKKSFLEPIPLSLFNLN